MTRVVMQLKSYKEQAPQNVTMRIFIIPQVMMPTGHLLEEEDGLGLSACCQSADYPAPPT
jgi:hypothetical protein